MGKGKDWPSTAPTTLAASPGTSYDPRTVRLHVNAGNRPIDRSGRVSTDRNALGGA